MDRNEIVKKLTEIFRVVLDEENLELHDELSSVDIDNWTSLTNMILIAEIEKQFSFKFKLKQLVTLKNVASFISAIEDNLKN